MKLRLFAVSDSFTGKLVPDSYRSSKAEARALRDSLNGTPGHNGCRFVVVRGPDHRRAS